MTPFACAACGHTVFFENDHCGHCGAVLGYVPGSRRMAAFGQVADGAAASAFAQAAEAAQAAGPGPDAVTDAVTAALTTAWSPAPGAPGPALRPCANRVQHQVCNWMLDPDDPHTLCLSCRLTRVIPRLDLPQNLARWRRIEQAKRRLVFSLIDLGLTPEPKQGPDDTLGLAFDLLDELPGGPKVLTGHDQGTVTLNVQEADDAVREARRVQLGEPARTLLGHLRHETAHYLQHRWVAGRPASEERSRQVFGDERADYAAALQQHYAQGPRADWSDGFVSAYASAHPWEDWAETCAHWLLVHDAVQTAGAWGLSLSGGPVEAALGGGASSDAPDGAGSAAPVDLHQRVLLQWLPVAQFLNAMNRSIGLPDSYPYLLPPAVLDKMATVQALLQAPACAGGAA